MWLPQFSLEMCSFGAIRGGCDAEAFGRAGGEFVGRVVAGGAAAAAGGSGGDRCVAGGRGVVGADRDALGGGSGGAGAPDDPDAELCAVDGGQAPLRLGLRDVDEGGLGLAASAAVLLDPARGRGAGRVDGSEADAQAGAGDGGGALAACD